eukprot:TRINITY_DN548_c0_g3_i1.p1 TRINITY_DN548_c0_g3~~TRINITY_DN548_c0_g3_i1.p1  ORF type:complete len:1234 (-),score=445.15 TRINITY_DN548_c0_g3_i1:1945-5646(-)
MEGNERKRRKGESNEEEEERKRRNSGKVEWWYKIKDEPLADALISTDWSKTPLGPIDSWPEGFQTGTVLCFTSAFPMSLFLGKELIQIYNKGYHDMFPSKHSKIWGIPLRLGWPEVWGELDQLIQGVCNKGEGFYMIDKLFLLEDSDILGEGYYNFSYSPLVQGPHILGIVNTVAKSDHVIRERRMELLRNISMKTGSIRGEKEIGGVLTEIFNSNQFDIPFYSLYLKKGEDSFQLSSSTHLNSFPFPSLISKNSSFSSTFTSSSSNSPERTKEKRMEFEKTLSESVLKASEEMNIVQMNLKSFNFPACGSWNLPVDLSCVIPLLSSGTENSVVGVLVTGINQHLHFTQEYQDFMKVLGNHISSFVHTFKLREENQKRVKDLSRLDRARTVFFTNISHEFKTPITLTLGPLEDLLNREHSELNPEQYRRVEVTYRNSLRLLKLVNHLLDFNELEGGKLVPKFEQLDISTLTSENCSLFGPACEKGKLSLSVKCNQIDEKIYIDRDMWEKIVFNLLSNSFKFTHEGGKIDVELFEDEQYVYLKVSDSGIGIPAKDIPFLGQRFFRANEGAQGRYAGTGIGLSLVSELVKLHGGSVQIQSELGKGTCVTIHVKKGKNHIQDSLIASSNNNKLEDTLAILAGGQSSSAGSSPVPYSPDNRSVRRNSSDHNRSSGLSRWLPSFSKTGSGANSPSSYSSRSPTSMNSRSPSNSSSDGQQPFVIPKILCLFHDLDLKEHFFNVLSNDYDMDVTTELSEALKNVANDIPDLILVDVSTKPEDGFSLVESMKKDELFVNVPIIFINARSGDYQIESLDRGVDDCLVMPFTEMELRARIASHIRNAQRQIQIKKQEQELRQVAEFATIAKDNFLATLAHEMRTPLAPALMLVEEMISENTVPQNTLKKIKLIHQTIQSEVFVIDNLLDMVKISKGKLALSLSTVDIHDCLKITGEKIESELSNTTLKIVWSLDAKKSLVSGDESRLNQIFWNVLKNAIKFGRDGKTIEVISRNSTESPSVIEVDIVDHGIGVHRKQLKNIFDPLEMHEKDPYKTTGLGVGLHITQQVVIAHGGSIIAQSKGLGKGSLFRISLPILQDKEAISRRSSLGSEKAKGLATVPTEMRPLDILLVEDNEAIRMVLTRLLTKMNHKVKGAGLVSEAVGLAKNFAFDLLISDIGLPDGNGYDLVKMVKEIALQSHKAIALSGYSLPEDVQASLDAGFDLHLTKPVQMAVLKEAIHQLCD